MVNAVPISAEFIKVSCEDKKTKVFSAPYLASLLEATSFELS